MAILDALGPIAWTALLVIAGLAAWNLLLFRKAPGSLDDAPSVSILIPARNEEANIVEAVRTACAQTARAVEVVVLDDGSTDATPRLLASLRAECPRLRVVTGQPLPPGWAGKAWACWQLASQHARNDWVLFVDADVRLASDAASRALAAARARRVDFLSAFPRQLVPTPGEALLVPLMYLLLIAYLPMAFIRWTRLPSLSAACGQFMLVRRAAYLAADGHRAAPGTLHDGVKLARRMKSAGFPIGIVDGQDLARCRMYDGFRASWRGFARNAYEALGSPLALAIMATLNVGFFVLPFLALPASVVWGGTAHATADWGRSVLLVVGLRVVLAWRYRYPVWTALATPVAVSALVAIQVESYLRHVTGRPVLWRARAYPGSAPIGKGKAVTSILVVLPLLWTLAHVPQASGAPAALPDVTFQDPEGRTLQLAALRGRVAVIVYGGRAGVDEHTAWGKRLDAELRQRGVYRAEDPDAQRPVRILAVAEMGGIPETFRPLIRAAVRPSVEKGYSLWLDWEDRMTRAFGAHEPHSTVLVANPDGAVLLVVGGPPTGVPLQSVLDLLRELVP